MVHGGRGKYSWEADCTHQHVFGQPAFVFGDTGGDAEGEALLPQQRVSSIAAAEGQDVPGVREVGYQHLAWVARPRVDQRSWRRRPMGAGSFV